MTQITVFYNPFLPELKVSVDGRGLSPYSSIAAWRHRRLETWCDDLFPALYREVNTDYEVLCLSTEFACQWLSELARRHPYCRSFTQGPLPLSAPVYERLQKLELLGCEADLDVVIPVVNASGDDGMNEAVYELLEEQGPFTAQAGLEAVWPDCPLTTVTLRTCSPGDSLPTGAPFALLLCGSEEDDVPVDAGLPVYALVTGTETRYLGHRLGRAFFNVDPDGLGDLLLDILAEAALCPLLSYLAEHIPPEAMALLTGQEKEELALVCQTTPVCRVSLPKVLDVGRPVTLEPEFFPADGGLTLRIVSDQPQVVDAQDGILCPRMPGTAEVSVFAGDDPYPAAMARVTVRERVLIRELSLFPSVLCLPEGGSAQLKVTVLPEGGENTEEIRWESSAPEVAEVDPRTGEVSARSCGRCTISASTPEAAGSASLQVQPPMEDILCPCTWMELSVGAQKEWRFQAVPQNAYGADTLRVTSSNKAVAEYRGGYILGKGPGRCVIRVEDLSGSMSRELQVAVNRSR